MRWFTILRILLAVVITTLAIGFALLSLQPRDQSPYLITRCDCPRRTITGDYTATIEVGNKVIVTDESVLFPKDSLRRFLRTDSSAGGPRYIRPRKKEVGYWEKILEEYIKDLEKLQWTRQPSDTTHIRLARKHELPLQVDWFSPSTIVAIPILFADVGNTPAATVNDSIRQITYKGNFDYTLSEKSKVLLKAKSGLVQKIFPTAKRIELIDAAGSEVYVFDHKLIGSAFEEAGLSTTTINAELINPLYNNVLGRLISDWSAAKIITWTIVTLVALFADKIRDRILKPVVDKVIPDKKPEKPVK